MKVIGAEPSANSINWIALNGSKDSGVIEPLSHPKIHLPTTSGSEVENLLNLKGHIRKYLVGFDKICIIKAGKDSSSIRSKIEFMIQLAAHEAAVEWKLVHPTKVAWAIRDTVKKETSFTLEEAFNSGSEITPKYLKKAAYCAWTGFVT